MHIHIHIHIKKGMTDTSNTSLLSSNGKGSNEKLTAKSSTAYVDTSTQADNHHGMYVCICMFVCIYMLVCMYVCMYVYIIICICVLVCVYVYVCIDVCICLCM